MSSGGKKFVWPADMSDNDQTQAVKEVGGSANSFVDDGVKPVGNKGGKRKAKPHNGGGNGGYKNYHKVPPHKAHRGDPVQVSQYTILAGGTRDLRPEDLDKADIVIPLQNELPARLGQRVDVLACTWRDYGPPPVGFEDFLREQVVPLLEQGKRLLVYCIGSHGRTGTFLASLIAILENRADTPDPIAAVRARHCEKSVETREQAAAVFAMRGEDLPEKYEKEFYRVPFSGGQYRGGYGDYYEDDHLGVGGSGDWPIGGTNTDGLNHHLGSRRATASLQQLVNDVLGGGDPLPHPSTVVGTGINRTAITAVANEDDESSLEEDVDAEEK